jgi:hypothetical protein
MTILRKFQLLLMNYSNSVLTKKKRQKNPIKLNSSKVFGEEMGKQATQRGGHIT